jgi:Mn-dependent DtxR family transcriptional regulator
MTELERRVLHVVHAHAYLGTGDVSSILSILGSSMSSVAGAVASLADRGLIVYPFYGTIWPKSIAAEVLDFCRWRAGLPSLLEISREEARRRLHVGPRRAGRA